MAQPGMRTGGGAWTGVFPIAPTPFDDGGQRRSRRPAPGDGLHGRPGRRRHLHPRQLLGAVPAHRHRARRAAARMPRAGRRAGAGDRDQQPLHHADRGRARRKAAADAGAAMLMLMPPYHGATLRADEAGILEQFRRVAEAVDAPAHGAGRAAVRRRRCRPRFLVRLAREVPLVELLQDRGAGRGREAAHARSSSAGTPSRDRSTARSRSR